MRPPRRARRSPVDVILVTTTGSTRILGRGASAAVRAFNIDNRREIVRSPGSSRCRALRCRGDLPPASILAGGASRGARSSPFLSPPLAPRTRRGRIESGPMSRDAAPDLEPEVEVACTVCGRNAKELLLREAEVKAQLAYLERFHRRRLRPIGRKSADDALADRADFTQDYTTDIVVCAVLRPRLPRFPSARESDRRGVRARSLRAGATRRALRVAARARPRESGAPSPPAAGARAAAAHRRDRKLRRRFPRRRARARLGRARGRSRRGGRRVLPREGLCGAQTTAPEAPIEPDSVDCVAIWNTFDQLTDPRPTLAAAGRWLTPGGLLAIRVPNGACFRSARRGAPANARSARPRSPRSDGVEQPARLPLPPRTLGRDARSAALPFDFQRIAVDADVLTRLADEQTKTWAVWEERLLKVAWRGLASARLIEAPWIDAYYRRTSEKGAASMESS